PRPASSSRTSHSGALVPRNPGTNTALTSRRTAGSLRFIHSPLDCTGYQALGQPPLDEDEEDHHGNRDQRRPRHHGSPVVVAESAEETSEPGRGGVLRVVGHERDREDELVPGRDEREDAGGDETRRDQRKQHRPEHPAPRRAVDVRGLLDLGWYGGDEPAQHPDGERQ